MKKALLASVVACALPLAAFAQTAASQPGSMSDPTMSSGADQSQPAMMSSSNKMAIPASNVLSEQDKTFIKMAAISGLAEVTDGRLAEQMGGSGVKPIAQRMVTDHTKANAQLAELSQQLGDPAPTQTDATHKQMTASLRKLSGTSFDNTYLKDQVSGHEKAIALFKKEIKSGSNPALMNFAQTTLPVLEMHLSMIKSAVQS